MARGLSLANLTRVLIVARLRNPTAFAKVRCHLRGTSKTKESEVLREAHGRNSPVQARSSVPQRQGLGQEALALLRERVDGTSTPGNLKTTTVSRPKNGLESRKRVSIHQRWNRNPSTNKPNPGPPAFPAWCASEASSCASTAQSCAARSRPRPSPRPASRRRAAASASALDARLIQIGDSRFDLAVGQKWVPKMEPQLIPGK